MCTSLGQTLRRLRVTPKYIVCDRDSIFDCDAFRRWVKREGICPPRYGAVGKHGSIAVIEACETHCVQKDSFFRAA